MSGPDLRRVLAALALLLAATHLMGRLFAGIRQAPAIGEILGGLLLGPTELGQLPPGAQAWLFPATGPAAPGRGATCPEGLAARPGELATRRAGLATCPGELAPRRDWPHVVTSQIAGRWLGRARSRAAFDVRDNSVAGGIAVSLITPPTSRNTAAPPGDTATPPTSRDTATPTVAQVNE